MSIRIVTHCYAVKYAVYAELLKFQISSLLIRESVDLVDLVVCLTPADHLTNRVYGWYEDYCQRYRVSRLSLSKIELPPSSLFRRAIGRNKAALVNQSDFVWFTDVDHVFGAGSLESIPINFPEHASMVYPREILIHKTHGMGHEATQHSKGVYDLFGTRAKDFMSKRYSKAIGGVQIVRGRLAREFGYLSQTAWQQPRVDNKPFADFRDDIAYRRQCQQYGPIQAVEIPNVYRLRHTCKTYG